MLTHIAPSQKNDIAYARKLVLNAHNPEMSYVAGLGSSNTRIVMIIAMTASMNAPNLSFSIISLLSYALLCCGHHLSFHALSISTLSVLSYPAIATFDTSRTTSFSR